MCRSMFMKGVECVFRETLLAAKSYAITDSVLETIQQTFSAYQVANIATMLVTTHAIHCGRRAHEMKLVSEMLEGMALPNTMSLASAELLTASRQRGSPA